MTTFEKANYQHYGLPVIIVGDDEHYAVAASEEAAEVAARQSILDSLWAVDARLVAQNSCTSKFTPDVEDDLTEALKLMQEKLCYDAGVLFKALLPGGRLDSLLDEVINQDGLGGILASHDSRECFFEDIFKDNEGNPTENAEELLAYTGADSVNEMLFYRIE